MTHDQERAMETARRLLVRPEVWQVHRLIAAEILRAEARGMDRALGFIGSHSGIEALEVARLRDAAELEQAK